ncbi:MAG TPA: DUF4136 domain-containing protein [Thermoanaerobaculia bacterium]|nr:DUF4136 domain-containing protein [Thermoanaerobaculia bacterium]
MKTTRLLALAAAMTVAACSGAPKIDGKLGPGASLAGKSTYALLVAPKGVGETTPAEVQFLENRAAPEVDRAMQAKGYRSAPREGADLIVAVFISDTGQVDAIRWGYSTAGWEIWGPWWGSGGYAYSGDYRTGTMVVDVADAREKKALYRGVATVTLGLSGNRGDLTQDQLRSYVERMLKELPPRS